MQNLSRRRGPDLHPEGARWCLWSDPAMELPHPHVRVEDRSRSSRW